jgi:DNA-directed RNA polymerase subunit RPC12/RpoP
MPVLINCAACKRRLRVRDDLVGKTIRCPACQGKFVAEVTRSGSESKPRSSSGAAATMIPGETDPALQEPIDVIDPVVVGPAEAPSTRTRQAVQTRVQPQTAPAPPAGGASPATPEISLIRVKEASPGNVLFALAMVVVAALVVGLALAFWINASVQNAIEDVIQSSKIVR